MSEGKYEINFSEFLSLKMSFSSNINYFSCPFYTIGVLYIFIGHIIKVDAKYCLLEVSGEHKYYYCPKNEYCCNFGCCINPAFQFYQLWYYWLLIIFVFLVCSGGGWWFKHCRSGTSSTPNIPNPNRFGFRTTPITSSTVNPSGRSRSRSHSRSCQSPRSSNTSRRALYTDCARIPPNLLIIEPNTRIPRMSPFYDNTRTTRRTNDFDDFESDYDQEADPKPPKYENPYYEIYGPPPSYDSVIGLSSYARNSSRVDVGQANVNVQPIIVESGEPTENRLVNSSTVPDNMNLNPVPNVHNIDLKNIRLKLRIYENPITTRERLAKLKRNRSLDIDENSTPSNEDVLRPFCSNQQCSSNPEQSSEQPGSSSCNQQV